MRAAPDGVDVATHLRGLEESLLDPDVRYDRTRMLELLAEDFVEFGSSGRVWNRKTILDLLVKETAFVSPVIEEFQCSLLSPELALVTYRTARRDEKSGELLATLRSSIWICVSGEWKMRFHQGTRTKAPA